MQVREGKQAGDQPLSVRLMVTPITCLHTTLHLGDSFNLLLYLNCDSVIRMTYSSTYVLKLFVC